MVDPAHPQSDRVVAELDGGGWSGFHFSEDGKRLCFVQFVSANESYIWVMEIATGKMRRITPPAKGETVFYGEARFTKDGKGLITTSDRDNEFRRLTYLPVNGGKPRVLTPKLAFDVDTFDISFDVNRIAFTTNEAGADVLRLMELSTFRELPRPPLVQGVIQNLAWRPKSLELAITMSSAHSAGDVFTYDLKDNAVTRWTNGNSPGVNTSEFAEARVIRWKSFDGLEVSGLYYGPPSRFEGTAARDHQHPRRARGPGAARLHRAQQLLRERAGRGDDLPERARLVGFRQDVPQARQRRAARGFRTRHRRADRLDQGAAVPRRLAHHGHGRQLRRLHDARLRLPLRRPDRERRSRPSASPTS